MRLKRIKLAGFKSFVDPTTVSFPSNLTAVVGPNGCGKSNVIDAVRWVMGESSAKQLRGESITDVIFNGSNTRKPTAQASIELVFDNSDGRAGGQYATFAEIAIRRQVTRDAQSIYFLNGVRCRRRDIQDIFLGTGLGPRSYSIIEQGMISNLIEARPEDLRNHLEEAAGISRYKERRRETENRIRHTRENLDRLNDLREELERQLARLQRQARSAEKYREYKAEERKLKAELLALRWQAMTAEMEGHNNRVNQLEVGLEQVRAGRQAVLTRIETERERNADLVEATSKVQQRFYELGATLARLEENLRARDQRVRQLETDLAAARSRREEGARHLELDARRIEELEAALVAIEPERDAIAARDEAAAAALEEAEATMQAWQQEWDSFNQAAAEPRRRAEVEASRIAQLEQSLGRTNQRLERLTSDVDAAGADVEASDLGDLDARVEAVEQSMAGQETELEALALRVAENRSGLEEAERQLADARGQVQIQTGRKASLEALQESALGRQDAATRNWLADRGLDRKPRLGERLHVQSGWETAVEAALGNALQAVVVDVLDAPAEAAMALDDVELTLFEGGRPSSAAPGDDPHGRMRLLDLVEADDDLASLLGGCWATENLASALALRDRLGPRESIVTRDGILIGRRWLRLSRGDAAGRGVLRRAQEIEALAATIAELGERADAFEDTVARLRGERGSLEQARAEAQQALSELSRQHGSLRAERSAAQARLEAASARQERLVRERAELEELLASERRQIEAAREARSEAEAAMAELESRREELLNRRDSSRALLEEARQQARARRDAAYELELKRQNLGNQLESTRTAASRLRSQQEELAERLAALEEAIGEARAPLTELRGELETELARRLEVEKALAAARDAQTLAETGLREMEQERAATEERVQAEQSALETARMERQAVEVRRRTLEEQLAESGADAATVLAGMAEGANEDAWQQALKQLDARINRLGPINLAAIEEYEQESERKNYLDAQNADLVEALNTLEEAIRKIDRETRARFKETFDKVNHGLQELFPKVFGGGHAYLELTGDDLLDTGVTIMARPPGKRNASIHLLSGGEKALTAIALVFSIFQLNPAPFCMLDEVDAPLDDANVGRFCRLLTEMGREVQFIFITHNKITMEMAEQLMGVTMQEAGVSRLVTVDVEQAAAMAG
ncbi:MAG: chromosome segregation protein SMC [Gammaproteobacteria bacterium]|nr:chromosome segregation protein SMC [Gammaproteobacteria bacterium]